MGGFCTAAILAPGPKGPIPTARFEMFREGLQESAARMTIEQALSDDAASGRLGEALVKRCRDLIQERQRVFMFIKAVSEDHGEGWKWFEGSGWEDRALDIFACAGEVTRALNR